MLHMKDTEYLFLKQTSNQRRDFTRKTKEKPNKILPPLSDGEKKCLLINLGTDLNHSSEL